jgi:type IV secretion system protein VirD4
VVPPSDINRTKPLIRLILNQVGRRLTEDLQAKGNRHRLLLMLDEFPALGRLDFFESALAFMAGYGLKAFLISQSLNQIEKAYGPNNSILDNCHVRVSFATNDERTAKRVSDALGTATEMKAMKNYAGHRLVAVAGASDGLALRDGTAVADSRRNHAASTFGRDHHGCRHRPDQSQESPILRGSPISGAHLDAANADKAQSGQADDWSNLEPSRSRRYRPRRSATETPTDDDTTESDRRHQPELSRTRTRRTEGCPSRTSLKTNSRDDAEDDTARLSRMNQTMRQVARQASLDPGDGIDL